MSEYRREHRDARRCPQCGARGILPLHQDPGEDAIPGTIENPVMICPVCDEEFRATGMTWMGAWSLADMTDAELDELTDVLIARMGEVARGSRKDRQP
jgi:hypothetical protein